MTRRITFLYLATLLVAATPGFSQPRTGGGSDDKDATIASLQAEIRRLQTQQMHQGQQIRKDIDDWMWFSRMADIAKVDKVRFTSKPPKMSNPTGQGYGNPLIISAYTFIPLSLKAGQKAPLVVLVHQGIHGNFETLLDLRTTRELLAEGYVIVAPEYRGSTGYGGASTTRSTTAARRSTTPTPRGTGRWRTCPWIRRRSASWASATAATTP